VQPCSPPVQRLDVGPSFALKDDAYIGSRNTELFCDTALRYAGSTKLANFQDLLFGQLAQPMILAPASMVRTCRSHFEGRSKNEVRRVTAIDGLASVAHPDFVQDCSMCDLPSDAMGSFVSSQRRTPEESFSLAIAALADPRPAGTGSARSVNVKPESLFHRHSLRRAGGSLDSFSFCYGSPCLPSSDFSDRADSDSELLRKRSLRFASEQFLIDLSDLSLGEGSQVGSSSSTATYVSHVVGLITKVKMVRVAAWRVIARMKDHHAFGDFSMRHTPCDSMSAFEASAVPEHPVAEFGAVLFRNPRPTSIQPSRSVDVAPESLFDRKAVLLDLLDDERVAVLSPSDVVLAAHLPSVNRLTTNLASVFSHLRSFLVGAGSAAEALIVQPMFRLSTLGGLPCSRTK
jgi:hypothetical protein